MAIEDCYQILGVNPNASFEEIRARFRFLAQAYHPDKFGSSAHKAQAEEEFKRINASYEILSNPEKRAEYDRKLAVQSGWSREEVGRKRGTTVAEEQRRTEYERVQKEQAEAEKRRAESERLQKEQAEADQRRGDFEKQRAAQELDIPENIRDGAGGTLSGVFYFSEKAGLYSLFRFYEDGLVIKVVISGINDLHESWSAIGKWFNRDHGNRGKYLLVDDFIKFKTISKEGKVDYNGKFHGDRLILNSYNHMNGREAANQEYIPLSSL